MSYALELKDLRKNFGKTEIIRGANLAVNSGERVAIIGPNGAGKSTLFNLISGRFGPTSGEILLNGQLVNLTAMETTVAFALLQRRGQIVPRQTLYQILKIDDDLAIDTRRLDVHISRIRSKLALNTASGWKLSSVYQRGYRIEFLNKK